MPNAFVIFPADRRFLSFAVAGLWLVSAALPANALARDYKVEILIFENLGKHHAYESYNYKGLDEMSSGSETWPIEPTMLLKETAAINLSADYRLLSSYSWGQESLPFSEAAAVKVADAEVNGWIKIYANQLLYANLDLDFNGYRMQENRRLKLDEKHFFDHPKFGLLMQVSRLEPPPENLDDAFKESRGGALQETLDGAIDETLEEAPDETLEDTLEEAPDKVLQGSEASPLESPDSGA